MKKSNVIIVAFLSAIILLGISACSDSSNADPSTKSQPKPVNTSQDLEDTTQSSGSSTESSAKSDQNTESNNNEQTTNSPDDSANEVTKNSVGDKEEKDILSQYSSGQIEYARVWLQLGPNQDIDELYVQHIPAGTPIDPNDKTSVVYPEDVIQLTGSRIVDGIVTYSGNGDGTINVYNVPRRWYGGFPPPEDIDKNEIRKQMEDIIENTKLVYVDPGDDEKVITLIKLLNVE